jgi:hypothetical protein
MSWALTWCRPWLALLLGGAIALGGCRGDPAAGNNSAEPLNQTNSVRAPLLPAPEAPLSREALLLAVVQARSAAAVGADDRTAQAEFDGKRFEFRIRLGCTIGPPDGEGEGTMVSFDPATRRVELQVQPDLSLDDPVAAAAAGGRFEAVEGFWIPHPWLLTSACPAVPSARPVSTAEAGMEAAEDGVAVAPQTVALAQFFTADGSRLQRRDGRAYSAREMLPEGAPPPEPGSWDLVITGRLRALDGRVIHCRPVAGAAMPVCIVSAESERVAIQNLATGNELARWSRE